MLRPKILRNEVKVNPRLKELDGKKLSIMQDYLWNEGVSSEDANVIIDKFNSSWVEAGGNRMSCIVRK